MVDELLIHRRLGELDGYVAELSKFQAYSLDDLTGDMAKAWAVSHGLQLAIQAVLDIGNHILAGQGVHAADYTDVIDKLGETGILPAGFARKIRGMAGLRNIIVHEYTGVDLKKLYNFLKNNLSDFTDFARYVTHYLEEGATGS
jgi:uncharacterized protein YutE (UPF0331/DUF86 family)